MKSGYLDEAKAWFGVAPNAQPAQPVSLSLGVGASSSPAISERSGASRSESEVRPGGSKKNATVRTSFSDVLKRKQKKKAEEEEEQEEEEQEDVDEDVKVEADPYVYRGPEGLEGADDASQAEVQEVFETPQQKKKKTQAEKEKKKTRKRKIVQEEEDDFEEVEAEMFAAEAKASKKKGRKPKPVKASKARSPKKPKISRKKKLVGPDAEVADKLMQDLLQNKKIDKSVLKHSPLMAEVANARIGELFNWDITEKIPEK